MILRPGVDPYELRNTYSSADPTVAPRPALKARLDALTGCQPQDDPTTPEVERSCQAAENAPCSSWLTKTLRTQA